MGKVFGISFADDVTINKFNLSDEAANNPAMLQHYSKDLAEARKTEDDCYRRLKFLKAQVELAYRGHPGTGITRVLPEGFKTTDTAIKALVDGDDEINELSKEYNEAREAVYTYEGAVDSIREKGRMIKVESDLLLGGLYSSTEAAPAAYKV